MKNFSKILIISLISLTSNNNNVFAEVFQQFPLNSNYSYIISFDSSIKQINIDPNNAIKVEIPVNLFNDKKDIIIIPLKETSLILKITTQSELYKFNLTINKENKFIPLKDTSFQIAEIDKPPALKNTKEEFILDQPPIK